MTFITIIIIEILAGAEIDIFVPSFPELQRVFGLSPFMVEMTLFVNLVAHCFTSLLVGNLGDRYGNKPIISIGLVIFIFGSILCVFTNTYWVLLFGRFLQGVGISGPAVLAYTVLSNLYSTSKQQQIMGTLNATVTIAMASAPVLGSYIAGYFGWKGNFIALLSLGILSLIMSVLFVPKGKENQSVSLSLKEYLPILRSSKALYYVITIGMFTQAYWIFIGIAPILYMEGLGVSLEHFGFYQGAICAVFAFVSLVSGYFLRKFGQKNCFFFGIYLFGVFIIATAALVILDVRNPLIITLLSLILSVANVFPINILWPLSLEAVKNAKGRISAMFVSSRLIITAISIQIVSYFYDGSFVQLGIAMCLTLLIGLWTCYKLFQQDKIFR
jgi:DHA1 family bicyclomycin/chloramphenicol resistance-like MFS transporter